VGPSIQLSDEAITQLVANRLSANWATKPIADRISIQTERGVVSLTGQVPGWAQRAEAERAARFTDGVREVDNRLTVSSER
jgi:osmotically-inducible protein OsmY